MLLLAFTAGSLNAAATTWLVGPAQTYTMPSQVSTLVQDGDTVLIDAGLYESDVARWQANDLVIKGVNGKAQLFSNGLVWGGKGIWVIQGDDNIVENIEFAEAACPDLNGAGIRQEGTNLTVRHCYFHDNENGILCGVDVNSDILVEHSVFYNNGHGDGYSHNLYIGHIHRLTFQYNYSHHADIGHELKSRAEENFILYNRFGEEATGTASRSIDLPNGGLAIILGNVIEQGPLSDNSNIIGYGMEGTTNTNDTSVYIVHNTIVNNKATGTFVQLQNGTPYCKLVNNIFAGPGTVLTGTPTTLDSGSNIVSAISGVGFIDAAGYDFQLHDTSIAVDHSIAPGMAGTFSLAPAYEYHDTAIGNPRAMWGMLMDAGAYEYFGDLSVKKISKASSLRIYPNPASGILYATVGKDVSTVSVHESTGKLLQRQHVRDGKVTLDVRYAPGVYFLKADNGDSEVFVVK